MKQRAIAATLAVGLMLTFPAPAFAQDGADADEASVLATVNGTEITAADVTFATEVLGEAIDGAPRERRNAVVLNLLIDMVTLAEAAKAEGLDDSATFERRAEYARMQALREVYMERLIEERVTDAAVRARFTEEAAKLGPEISASHILVEERKTADDLLQQLDGGADFAELARENSQDPGSAARGGSLGFFSRGQMVPAFEEAAFELNEGEITDEPIQSRFGWHIIRLDEKRERALPEFERVAGQIREVMIREVYAEELARLRDTVEVVRTDAAPSVDAPAETAPATGDDGEGEAAE